MCSIVGLVWLPLLTVGSIWCARGKGGHGQWRAEGRQSEYIGSFCCSGTCICSNNSVYSTLCVYRHIQMLCD